MRAQTFWKTVVADQTDFLSRSLTLLSDRGIRFCVLGGQGVNAYVDPVVSLVLDLVIAVDQLSEVEAVFDREFRVERFPHSLNVSSHGSDLRIQIQLDPRYASFVDRAAPHEVLGLTLPVATVEDILQGKIWAVLDPHRHPSKRQKDLADISRLLEAFPPLRQYVPDEILNKLM